MTPINHIICLDCLNNNSFEQFLKTKKIYQGICEYCEGPIVTVDKLMVETVVTLISKGYMTSYCCSGHVKGDQSSSGHPYLMILGDTSALNHPPLGWHIDEKEVFGLGQKSATQTVIFRSLPGTSQIYYNKINKSLLNWAKRIPRNTTEILSEVEPDYSRSLNNCFLKFVFGNREGKKYFSKMKVKKANSIGEIALSKAPVYVTAKFAIQNKKKIISLNKNIYILLELNKSYEKDITLLSDLGWGSMRDGSNDKGWMLMKDLLEQYKLEIHVPYNKNLIQVK